MFSLLEWHFSIAVCMCQTWKLNPLSKFSRPQLLVWGVGEVLHDRTEYDMVVFVCFSKYFTFFFYSTRNKNITSIRPIVNSIGLGSTWFFSPPFISHQNMNEYHSPTKLIVSCVSHFHWWFAYIFDGKWFINFHPIHDEKQLLLSFMQFGGEFFVILISNEYVI